MRACLRRIFLLAVLLAAASLVPPDSPLLSAAGPEPCADLVITDFSISPPEPVQGENAQIDITVLNQGTCESLSFVVQWKSDPLALTGPSTHVDGLPAGDDETVSFQYAFPHAGNFTTVAIADSDNTAPETNENNNLEILPITVQESAPDLVITSLVIVPAEPVQGINAQINVRVANHGNLPAGPFVVQWKSDRWAPTGPSTQVDGLEVGHETDVSFEYAFPHAGDFTTVAHVDTDNDVDESNEDNNLAILPVTVREAAPDLVITDFTIVPVDPAPGFPLLPVEGLNARIDITVLNQGNAAAGSFVVQWKSGLFAPTGPSTHVSGLEPQQSTTATFEYAFPNAGDLLTLATVDTDNTVDEFNESNNLAILAITVQEAVVDLVLTGFAVEPAPGVPVSIPPQPVQGRLTQATIKLENHGNYPAGDFVVEWKPTLLSPGLSTQVNGLGYGQVTTVTFDYTYPFAGEFLTLATVDSTHRVQEIDESNNSEIKLVIVEPPRADLVITGFTFDPAQPVQGTKAAANIEILNRGNSPAGPFVVKWKPTPLAPPQSIQVNGLEVGQFTVVSFDHTYLFAGEFATTAEVDSTNWVLELDEDNNSQTRQVIVQVATRDLIITDFQIVPDDGTSGGCVVPDDDGPPIEPVLEQGANAKICITVQNLGNSAIGPFVVEWNPDALGLITPSPATLSTQVDDLGAGQETQVIFNFIYPQAGEFRTVAKVDAFNDVDETNEMNNLAILNVVVTPSGPDLVITDLAIGHGRCSGVDPVLEQGRTVLVCIEVENQGNRSAGPFVVEWNPDALGLITPGPGTVSEQINSLDVDQSELVILEFIYTEAGTFHTVAMADAFNNVAETNEANNLAVVDVVVEPSGPDLVITALTIEPERSGPISAQAEQGTDGIEPVLVQGEKAIVSITVENQGDRSAGPFVVEWNPDAFGLITPSPGTLSTQIDGLAPLQSAQVTFEFIYHQHGGFRTVAKADAFNNVQETNEANNLKILNVVVEPAKIDLQITDFTITPDPPIRGSKATAHITVRNYGSYPTGSFWVQWKPTGRDSLSGPLTMVDGLHPHESVTVTLDSVFWVARPYTSWAMVDVFDQIIETDETNNEAEIDVTVKPRETEIKVTFTSIHVSNEAQADAWLAAFLIPEEEASCMATIIVDPDCIEVCVPIIGWPCWEYCPEDVSVPINETGFHCRFYANNAVHPDQNLPLNKTIDVTIIESAPLIVASAALEVNGADWGLSSSTSGIHAAADDNYFAGYVIKLHSANERWGEGTHTETAQDGDACGSSECFDLTYKVEIASEPPPLAFDAEEPLPPEYVVLPARLCRLLPINAQLPDGVRCALVRLYLPLIVR
jgi:subtilase family serine protease